MIPIYILSWHRVDMLRTCLEHIENRTRYPHEVHVWCNEAWEDDITDILQMDRLYTSVHFDKRNTAVWYPRLVAHAMTTGPYFVLTDADVYPPSLGEKCWLTRLVETIERNTELASLAAQLPPQALQGPTYAHGNYVECKATGNTLKLVRTSAWPKNLEQKLGQYGDDGILSKIWTTAGFHVGFARDVYCLHAGQCINWGYKPDEIAQDPRKAGYGEPYTYEFDPETYVPTDRGLRL